MAVVLVAGAIAIRQAVVGGDGASGASKDDPTPAGPPRVACAPDLATVCDRLAAAGKIAKAPPTLEVGDAADPPEGIDGWITWDPAPRVAEFADRNDTVWERADAVAHGRLAVAGTADALAEACGTARTWACVAGAPRKGPSVGVGDPSSAEGLARLAPLVKAVNQGDLAQLVGRVREVVDSPQLGQAGAGEMATRLVTQPGAVDLVVAPTTLLADAVGTPQGRSRDLQLRAIDPELDATVVVATRPGAEAPSAEAICKAAGKELAAVGAVTCGGPLLTDKLAGLLYQVHRSVG